MAEYHLSLPPRPEEIDRLRAGDVVYLSGEMIVTGGGPTHQRMLKCLEDGLDPPMVMNGSFVHLPHMVEPDGEGGYTIHYVNPTTSIRFDSYMPRLIRGYGLKIIGGKGGLGPETVKAMQETGCVYLALLGGGSPMLTAAIKTVLQAEWRDLPQHFWLSRLLVEDFGPLTVGIDAHGASVYAQLADQAEARLPAILARLDERRSHPEA